MKRNLCILLVPVVLLCGCLGGSGKTPFIRQYVLEYAPPGAGAGMAPAVQATLRVERFPADRLFMDQAMLYRQGPHRRDAYPAHRWRVAPGNMVAEFLRRDLRAAGLFRAVLSERDAGDARYSLTGGVEQFIQSREAPDRRALMAVTVTLLDLAGKDAPELVVFQRTYHAEAAIVGEGGAGLAAAMSLAMADLSRRVIADVAAALR